MRKLLTLLLLLASVLLLAAVRPFPQSSHASPANPTNQIGCPDPTAIPPFVGPGTSVFSPNESLCLPQLAPVPTGLSPLAFIVKGVEPGDRVDAQGTAYVVSIRGVPGGVDLWRWSATLDGAPNSDGTLPFKYEGQPDNCGILTNGCDNNVGSPLNLGLAPGGGDADIAVNGPPLGTTPPNLALTSLTLAPGVSATHSTNRGDSFSPNPPNVAAALIPGDDRMWNDAFDDVITVYMGYHDVATFNIDVQRSNDGGATYVNGFSEAIDPQTFPAAGGVPATNSANVAGQIKIDHNTSACPSRGNLYQVFVAPDSMAENLAGGPLRSAYVGVSTDVNLGLPVFTFTDHKVFTSPAGSLGATYGTNQVFPALALDNFGFVYAVWSDNSNIFFTSSADQGATWTAPLRVNSDPTVGKSNVFPWVAADANGHAVVGWLGANLAGNSNDRTVMEKTCSDGTNSCWAQWNVYAAESVNAHDAAPLFTQHTASDHIIHAGTVSTGGLGGGANRNLADFFQVALDPQHRANISFADDHIASSLCTSQSPGHCANNDPQSFRVGVPYFTYQLKANPHIVTGGLCAGQPPAAHGHRGHGRGQTASNANFAFIAQDSPENAVLSFQDSSANMDVRSSNVSIPAVTFSGNCAMFSGSAKLNQQPGYTYTVNACDNGDPGSGAGLDTFSIQVTNVATGFVVYFGSGPITAGDIEILSQ